jgi:hypothetical protein
MSRGSGGGCPESMGEPPNVLPHSEGTSQSTPHGLPIPPER